MISTLSPDTTATAITPRPYQREAVQAILDAHGKGMCRPLVALPTGTGKTIVFALLAQQRGGRTLVLAHRDELISQAVDKLQLVMPGLDIGVVKAEHNDVGPSVSLPVFRHWHAPTA